MVKVLVVDDSAFVRRSLAAILEKDKDIEIAAFAVNGLEAVELARKHDPDVITMDVEMPKMNGLEAVERIMAENPCPILMISSLTDEGADVTLRALEFGALDYMPKLSSSSLPDMKRVEVELLSKVKALARRKAFMRLRHNHEKLQRNKGVAPTRPAEISRTAPGATAAPAASVSPVSPAVRPTPRPSVRGAYDVVAIGVSTGGPPAVQKLLSGLPEDFPVPILIAQHMPAAFTGPFAKRLDGQCPVAVKEAESGERLRPGTVYICPGGKHLRLEMRGGMMTGIVTEEPKEALYKPSANVLMETVGMALGRRALSVMLTGMGNDGLEGVKVLKQKGGRALAQSEASCVVYGMPKAVVDAGLADEVVDLDDMAAAILAHFGRSR